MKKLTMTGVKRKGESGFKTVTEEKLRPTEPPAVEPHLVHDGTGTPRCSECGTPVNIPAGTCGTCPNCLTPFGGCG